MTSPVPQTPEPTDEQLEAAWQAVRPDYTVMDRRWTSNAQNAQVDRVARALAAAVQQERDKVLALHCTEDVFGDDLLFCAICRTLYPCSTARALGIREVSR